MHRETKHTAIPNDVKKAVYRRDNGRCVLCGCLGEPVAHVIRRSHGGMGVEQNIVTLCPKCHYAFDEGLFMSRLRMIGLHTREEVKNYIFAYMKRLYPDWTPESVVYRKRRTNETD